MSAEAVALARAAGWETVTDTEGGLLAMLPCHQLFVRAAGLEATDSGTEERRC